MNSLNSTIDSQYSQKQPLIFPVFNLSPQLRRKFCQISLQIKEELQVDTINQLLATFFLIFPLISEDQWRQAELEREIKKQQKQELQLGIFEQMLEKSNDLNVSSEKHGSQILSIDQKLIEQQLREAQEQERFKKKEEKHPAEKDKVMADVGEQVHVQQEMIHVLQVVHEPKSIRSSTAEELVKIQQVVDEPEPIRQFVVEEIADLQEIVVNEPEPIRSFPVEEMVDVIEGERIVEQPIRPFCDSKRFSVQDVVECYNNKIFSNSRYFRKIKKDYTARL